MLPTILISAHFKGVTIVKHELQLEKTKWTDATLHQNKFFTVCTRLMSQSPKMYSRAPVGSVLFKWNYRFVRPDKTWKMKEMSLVKTGNESFAYRGDTTNKRLKYRVALHLQTK